jgi:hypothetical protein
VHVEGDPAQALERVSRRARTSVRGGSEHDRAPGSTARTAAPTRACQRTMRWIAQARRGRLPSGGSFRIS